MNNLRILSLSIMVLVFISIIGCSKKSDNPVDPGNVVQSQATLTLNGAGFSNQSVTLGTGGCAYSPSENLTAFEFSGVAGNDSLIFVFQFVGNQTGAHPWRSTEPDVLIYKYGASGNFYFYADSTGSTNVTSYGAVNGKIEGSINGNLIEATSQTTLSITSGTFSALRIPDTE
jgi:hypothetical protein